MASLNSPTQIEQNPFSAGLEYDGTDQHALRGKRQGLAEQEQEAGSSLTVGQQGTSCVVEQIWTVLL